MEIFRPLNKEPFWSHHMLVLSLSVVFFLILKHFLKCGCFRKTKKLVRSFLFGLFRFRAILIKFGFLVFSDDLGHLGIPLRACWKQKN